MIDEMIAPNGTTVKEWECTKKLIERLSKGGSVTNYFRTTKRIVPKGKKKQYVQWFDPNFDIPHPVLDDGYNQYYSVHPCFGIPETNSRGIQTGKENIRTRIDIVSATNCVYGEFDDKSLEEIRSIDPIPSIIVESSPGKYHVYWLLRDTFMITTEEEREKARSLQQRWVEYVGSDDASKDLARALRVPGTCNYKYDDEPEVKIIEEHYDREYTLEELESKAPQQSKIKQSKSKSILEGKRNPTLYTLACSLRGKGLSKEAIFAEIQVVNQARCKPPLDNSELETIAESASKHTQNKGDTTEDIISAIRDEIGITFRMDLCNDDIELWGELTTVDKDGVITTEQLKGAKLSDPLRSTISSRMRDLGFKNKDVILDAIIDNAYANRYDGMIEYLNSLVWNGEDMITRFATYIQCVEHIDTIDDKGNRRNVSAFYLFLKKWMIGAVAKVLDQEQNVMLVLAGEQDIGKSAIAAFIGSVLPKYFLEGPISTDDKDSAIRLMSKFVHEVGELGATTRKADIEALKEFITRRIVTVRKSYGRSDTEKPARASLIGTVNDDGSGFLLDNTGNRRFMTCSLTSINFAYRQEIDMHQLWAQAVHLYKHRADGTQPWLLTSEEKRQQRAINEKFEAVDPYVEYMQQYFDINPKGLGFITTTEIMRILENFAGVHAPEKQLSMAVSRACASLGLKKAKQAINGKRLWGYVGISLSEKTRKLMASFPRAENLTENLN